MLQKNSITSKFKPIYVVSLKHSNKIIYIFFILLTIVSYYEYYYTFCMKIPC